MPTLIKYVRGKNKIEFDTGSFDKWCVYLSRPNQPRYAPSDKEYFSILTKLATLHGAKKIYEDFLRIYSYTDASVNPDLLEQVTAIAGTYQNDAEEIDIWFTVIYVGMIAEENKEKSILKKRIKRLGLHQVLIENAEPEYAANFSKRKKWEELNREMIARGF